MTVGAEFTTEEWRRARSVFERLLDCEPARRSAELKQACADDPRILEAVQALLEQDRTDSLPPLAQSGPRPSAAAGPGSHLGGYRLHRVLGRGGTGTVYLGSRDPEDFEQFVAIKILHQDIPEAAKDRFRRERRILAQLEHPNVARLIDGGTTADGQSYVVMEYVDGVPITAYCDEHRLDVDRRLELFRQVLRAVHFAHRFLIVHRDLKPDNILVTAEGEVKLLDFGIAKRLDPRDIDFSDGPGNAQLTCPWLTPAYASPEQFLGAPTTVQSDVYSLGVVLFELLTGQSPYAALGQRTPIAWDVAPPSPSSVVSGQTDDAAAQARGTQPAALFRRLRGDLDDILLQALRDEPDARYSSVEAFDRDLQSHQLDLPVQARADSAAYRTRKFLKRHALASALAGCLLIAISTFGWVSWQQSKDLLQERDATERQRLAAESTAEYLAELVKLLRPVAGSTFDPAARRILDYSTATARAEYADQPEMRAVLLGAIGSVYRDLAFFDAAEPLLVDHLDYVLAHPSEPVEVSQAFRNLAELRISQGRTAEAQPLLEAALPYIDNVEERMRLLSALGIVLEDQGEREEAKRVLEEGLELARTEGDEAPYRVVARLRNSLALILKRSGDFEAAQANFGEALRLYRGGTGSNDLNVAAVLNNLGTLAAGGGDFAGAAEHLREGLNIRLRLQGDRHPEVTAVRGNLAAVLHLAGDYGPAETLYRQTLARSRKDADPRALATDLSNLGILLREMGRAGEAEDLLREALHIRRDITSPDHSSTATPRHNLGLVLLDLGDLEEAAEHLRRAADIREEHLGKKHWLVGNSRNSLAVLALRTGDPCRAADLALEASTILAEALPGGHWRFSVSQSLLGAAWAKQGRLEEAQALLDRSLEVIAEAKGRASRHALDAEARTLEARAASGPWHVCPSAEAG
ncbi:MAG: serine/threonine-protein kinase [Acidobacteriota bacterium]